MGKKSWIGILIVLAFAAAAMYYQHWKTKDLLSPPAEQRIVTQGGLEVHIDYSRPSKRGRLIFGSKAEGALQPYGAYWRLGANASTVFEFNERVEIAGKALPAGSFGVYAFPGPDSFEVVLNKTWDRWGLTEPDHDLDVIRFKVPVQKCPEPVEQFTIVLAESDVGIKVIGEWDEVRFVIPITEVD